VSRPSATTELDECQLVPRFEYRAIASMSTTTLGSSHPSVERSRHRPRLGSVCMQKRVARKDPLSMTPMKAHTHRAAWGLGTTRTTAEGTTTQPDSRSQQRCSTMPSPATAAPSSRASSTVLASDHPAPGTRPLPSQRIPVQSSSMVRHRRHRPRSGRSPRCRPEVPLVDVDGN
jgi:hypothetical protein